MSIEINSLGPNLWISHEWAGAQPLVGLGGHRPTHSGARPGQSELVSPHKGALLEMEILFSFISCPGGWFQTIPQVKKLDVEVLGLNDYTWSAVLRLVGHSCSQHANSTLPELETCGIVTNCLF